MVRRLAAVAVTLAALAALMLPAIANRSPILFPDTVGYIGTGNFALHELMPSAGGYDPVAVTTAPDGSVRRDGPEPFRSPWYGLLIVLLNLAGGPWAIALAQAALALIAMYLAARRNGLDTLWSVAVAAVVASVSGLGFFTSTIMPDVYAGLMILAAAMLIGYWHASRRLEISFWLAIATYAMLAHKGHIPVMAALLGVAAAVLAVGRRFDVRPFLALSGTVVLAVIGQAMIGPVIRQATGQPALDAPFMLARMIGDGTAKTYLDEECPTRRLLLCRYKDHLPRTENDFLWSTEPGVGLFNRLGTVDRQRIVAESGTIVHGVLARHPGRQTAESAQRMAAMVVLVGVTRYGSPITTKPPVGSGFDELYRDYPTTRIASGRFPMRSISRAMTLVYCCAFIVLGWLASRPASRVRRDPAAFSASVTIIVGLLCNAFVFGALSSAADRYQGRVAWLVPFLLLALFGPDLARRLRALVNSSRAPVAP